MLDHLEGRLDRMTAVIRQVAVQGRTPEPATPGEGASRAGSRDSSEELEVPALQSSLGELQIMDVEPKAERPRREPPGRRKTQPPTVPGPAAGGKRRKRSCRWKTKGDGPRKNTTRLEA